MLGLERGGDSAVGIQGISLGSRSSGDFQYSAKVGLVPYCT